MSYICRTDLRSVEVRNASPLRRPWMPPVTTAPSSAFASCGAWARNVPRLYTWNPGGIRVEVGRSKLDEIRIRSFFWQDFGFRIFRCEKMDPCAMLIDCCKTTCLANVGKPVRLPTSHPEFLTLQSFSISQGAVDSGGFEYFKSFQPLRQVCFLIS
jgi:hypothetical protein